MRQLAAHVVSVLGEPEAVIWILAVIVAAALCVTAVVVILRKP